ncbi:MAG: DEAD/DEAH box helicase [Parachlamydiales bacterium]|jgi:superfamily II DNA/RNA helicase
MSDFKKFAIPESLIKALDKINITTPTPIQDKTIPVALEGKDILASAQTGTGKTIAYSLPLLTYLLKNPRALALIIAPTRELAAQVNQSLRLIINKNFTMNTALLIGGESMFKQFAQLRAKPQIIIGTPGRITDHLTRGSLKLQETKFLIIDEADRMLDMGFGIQLEKIETFLPAVRQTLMFSATFPANIEKLSQRYLKDPQRIAVGSVTDAAPKIKQEVLHTHHAEKFGLLSKELELREGSIIVFVKTKKSADRLAEELQELGHNTDAIHGDLHQRKRDKVIQAFRSKKSRILIATDVAARGLDIPHVMHVINYDLPQCPEDYIHRIGRTARAGAEGNALCLIAPDDRFKWKCIQKLMNPQESKDLAKVPDQSNYLKAYDKNDFSKRRHIEQRKKKRPFFGEKMSVPAGRKPFKK